MNLSPFSSAVVYFKMVKLLTRAAITITAPITTVIVSIKTISFLCRSSGRFVPIPESQIFNPKTINSYVSCLFYLLSGLDVLATPVASFFLKNAISKYGSNLSTFSVSSS